MEKLIRKLNKAHSIYEGSISALEKEVRQVCDFDARITWCVSDGHLVLNQDTAHVAGLSCLHQKTENNKLSEEQHFESSI